MKALNALIACLPWDLTSPDFWYENFSLRVMNSKNSKAYCLDPSGGSVYSTLKCRLAVSRAVRCSLTKWPFWDKKMLAVYTSAARLSCNDDTTETARRW